MQLYISSAHSCSYLPGREAKSLFIDPDAAKDSELYGMLIDIGFRRSGEMIYRPKCDHCQACTSIRIPVENFQPRRIQRRIRRKIEADIEVIEQPATFNPEHFELFRNYIDTRHRDGEMADTSEQGYIQFLGGHWGETRFLEFRLSGQLMAVAVTDRVPQALSAVYTFFDPKLSHLSPGVYAVLWQIAECKRLGLPWLYLGYWIGDCRKMAYKTDYRPFQAYNGSHWQEYSELPTMTGD
ncbi:MAG: arginyltransferase [Candidatus Sedimenticola sp. (ex Thyasira tokunagai)]